MKEFEKTKKRYNILAIILIILTCIVLVAGVSLEILAEIDNTVTLILFTISLALIVLIIPILILIARYQSKIAKTIVSGINRVLDTEYTYQEGSPILDIVEDSMYPYNKDTSAFSQDGIIGNYEDTSFEYYICTLSKDSIFSKDSQNTYEVYVFKNVCVFPKEFFVTAKKLKDVEQYKVLPTTGEASIYTMKNDEIQKSDLPKDVLFLSVKDHSLYVYKTAERKKALFQIADDIEDFKVLFTKEIEKVKNTYEQTKVWL